MFRSSRYALLLCLTRVAQMYKLRPAYERDIPQIARFVVYWDAVVSGYSDFDEDDLREMWGRHPCEGWIATAKEDIVGLALLWRKPGDLIEAFGMVDPAYTGRGIGSELLTRLQKTVENEPPGVIFWVHVDAKDAAGRDLVTSRGLKLIRRNFTMRRHLGDPIEPVIPSGITIRSCELSDARLVHELTQETFSGHWGWTGTDYDTWERTYLARSDVDPSLWHVAYEGAEPVGMLVGSHTDETGWVDALGVRKAWRGRGVGRALLESSFSEFLRRGAKEAVLGVDAGNETGAVQLYEGVGMAPIKVYETYEQRY
jgi:mycothiol synthase